MALSLSRPWMLPAVLIALSLASTEDAHAAPRATTRPAVRFARASSGMPGAMALARIWAEDAVAVYVENADSLAADGSSRAWSYVFWSAAARQARGFTSRTGGAFEEFDLPFPFDPPALDEGWLDATDALARAASDPRLVAARADRVPRHAVLARGLAAPGSGERTTWLITFEQRPAAPGILIDAHEGRVLDRVGAVPAGALRAPSGPGLPMELVARQGQFLARIEELRVSSSRLPRERQRWLEAEEARAVSRLENLSAARDSLDRDALAGAGATLATALADLARWNEETAGIEAALAASDARLAAAARDLAAERPTELAIYLSVEGPARPARVSVQLDGAELATVAWGEKEWRILESGAFAEVTRAAIRPLAHDIRIEIEGADRRSVAAAWRGAIAAGRLGLLHARLAGDAARPTLSLQAESTP